MTLTESESAGLSFDSHNDALDYVNELVESGADFLAVNKLNFVERYKDGRLVIHLKVRIGEEGSGDSRHYSLVFVAIPERLMEDLNARAAGTANSNEPISHYYRPKDAVLISVGELVQCPEEIIPSFVWLSQTNDVLNVLWEFAATTFQGVLKVGFEGHERKEANDYRNTAKGMDTAHNFIQSITEVDCGITSMASNRSWNGLEEFEFEQIVSAIHLWLSDVGASVLVVKESIQFPIEFGNVILCPIDAVLWGFEGVTHAS